MTVADTAARVRNPAMVPGDITGLLFPTSVEWLREAGTEFLTRAFRASGALGQDNSVTHIDTWVEFFGGGMGRKIQFDVVYEKHDPSLKTRMFAKFTREFDDPLHQLLSPVMEPEVRFAMASRCGDFPITVPECYFADFNAEYLAGLLITERIAYGEGRIEPPIDKCLDYLMDAPLEYYASLTRGIGALAGYHRSGRFGEDIEKQFPFDKTQWAVTRTFPCTREEFGEKLEKLRVLIETAPHLLPGHLTEPAFLRSFLNDAMLVFDKELLIVQHLGEEEALIALCHWNMNPDNAWFWRDEQGGLQSGQLDWGGVRQMHLAQSYCGMICSGETDFLAEHDADLQSLLLEEYVRSGGPVVDAAAFARSVNLSMALLGCAWLINGGSLIPAEIANYPALESRYDPMIRDSWVSRTALQFIVLFMSEWHRKDFGAHIHAL